jgi:hypothetical protein
MYSTVRKTLTAVYKRPVDFARKAVQGTLFVQEHSLLPSHSTPIHFPKSSQTKRKYSNNYKMYFKTILLASLVGRVLAIPAAAVARGYSPCPSCADSCFDVFEYCIATSSNSTSLILSW